MKRGSFVGRRKPLNRVSAKVTRARPGFDEVYRFVNARSEGQCEIHIRDGLTAQGIYATTGRRGLWRCLARATEHHHLRKPRRSYHLPVWIVHLCRRHHDMTTASYRVGRLEITLVPGEPASFVGCIVQKANKWA